MPICVTGIAAIRYAQSSSMSSPRVVVLSVLLVSTLVMLSCRSPGAPQARRSTGEPGWPGYGGGSEGIRYSSLTQINRHNVQTLEVAWTYDSGEVGGLETQPIVIDGVFYASTPSDKVVALDAATGELLWRFDTGPKGSGPNRGLAYWREGDDERLFATVDRYLYSS